MNFLANLSLVSLPSIFLALQLSSQSVTKKGKRMLSTYGRGARIFVSSRLTSIIDNPGPCSSGFLKTSRLLVLSDRHQTTIPTAPDSSSGSNNPLSSQFWNLMKVYEDVIGITEVREAQDRVVSAETEFSTNQERRREKQEEITNVQNKLKEIHSDLDKTSRGEDRYLHLLTQEHAICKQERAMLADFSKLERLERDSFSRLSFHLRESHEKERERGERTKYWSIIGSCIGATIGIIGATVNNRLRMRDLKALVVESTAGQGSIASTLGQLTNTLTNQQTQMQSFIQDLGGMIRGDATVKSSLVTAAVQTRQMQSDEYLSQQSDAILHAVEAQNKQLEKEMDDVKKMLAAQKGYSVNGDGSIVYVGPEIETLLDKSEQNIEWKLKMQTLFNVVMVYGALAVTLPVLYIIFRGNP